MTFTEIFEAIAEATGIEYSHFSVLGRIWDLADYYGVERRGKLVSQVLRELPQLVNKSPESNLISDLLNLTMRYSKYLCLTGAYHQDTTTGAQKIDVSMAIDRNDTKHTLTNTGLTVTGLWYVECYVDVTPNTDMYLSYAKTGSGVNSVAIFNEEGTTSENQIVGLGGTGGTFNTGDNNQVRVLFYSGSGTSASSTYNDVMLCEGTSAKPYEPYTGGAPSPNPDYAQEMQAVEISELHSSGKNLFSGLIKGSGINSITGAEQVSDVSACSDYIPVKAGQEYYISGLSNTINSFVAAYDYEKNFIGRTSGAVASGRALNNTTLLSAIGTGEIEKLAYLRVTQYVSIGNSGTIDDVDGLEIMLNVGDTAEPYTPYTGADTVTLSEPLILRALPNGVADSYEDGVITRRVGVMEFDGSADENWKIQRTSNPNVASFYIDVSNNKSLGYTSMLCDKLTPNVSGLNNTSNVNVCSFNSTNGSTLIMDVANEIVTIVDDWRTYLQSNPITVWYEPATPTTEALDIDLEWYGMENFWTDSELDPNMTWKGVSTGVD